MDYDPQAIAAAVREQAEWDRGVAERKERELRSTAWPRCKCGREALAGREHCGYHYPPKETP